MNDQPKRLFIVRGLPGSGKTTLAKLIMKGLALDGYDVAEISTDDYFTTEEGVYDFNPNLLDEAHEFTQKIVRVSLLNERHHTMIVHNTFSQQWEAQPYIDMAEEHGYDVFIVEAQNDFGSDHGVPQKVCDNMEARWLPINP